MTTDVIAARLRALTSSARCRGCDSTAAECNELFNRPGNDAPFGCCSGCDHVLHPGSLTGLAQEIESGAVRSVAEAHPKPRAKTGMTWHKYLDQGEKWQPNGRPMIAISDMDLPWRYNAARWLERNAVRIAKVYTLAEALELDALIASPLGPSEMAADSLERWAGEAADRRHADPVGWIRTTILHKALVAGLPDCSIALDAIAAQARHYSTCPARTGAGDCACETIRARYDAEQEELLGVPEWTS